MSTTTHGSRSSPCTPCASEATTRTRTGATPWTSPLALPTPREAHVESREACAGAGASARDAVRITRAQTEREAQALARAAVLPGVEPAVPREAHLGGTKTSVPSYEWSALLERYPSAPKPPFAREAHVESARAAGALGAAPRAVEGIVRPQQLFGVTRGGVVGSVQDRTTMRTPGPLGAGGVDEIRPARDVYRPGRGTVDQITPVFHRRTRIDVHDVRKVCQLTGNEDRGWAHLRAQTGMVKGGGSKGITGTDLGWSFEHAGRLYFLFGDTRNFSPDLCEPLNCGTERRDPSDMSRGPLPVYLPGPNFRRWPTNTAYWDWLDTFGNAPESMASVPLGSFDPERCIPLEVASDGGQTFRPTRLNRQILERSEGAFSGFSGGASVMYAFFTLRTWPEGCPNPWGCAHDARDASGEPVLSGRLVLAQSTDGGRQFEELATFSTEKFQFVAPTVIEDAAARFAGLPPELGNGPIVFAFGSGRDLSTPGRADWGKSPPYLAIAALSDVATRRSEVWARRSDGTAYKLDAPMVGTRQEDRWVLAQGTRILVVRSDGFVWAHEVGATKVEDPYPVPPVPASPGKPSPRVATDTRDKWVLMHTDPVNGDRILVVREDGSVVGYPVSNVVGAAEAFTGPAVGARPEDRWVLVVGSRIVVITKRGRVFAHELSVATKSIGSAVELDATRATPDGGLAKTLPPVSATERWMLGLGTQILRVTGRGEIYSNTVGPRRVEPQQQLYSGMPVGTDDHDRWLLVVGPPFAKRLIEIRYYLTKWRYYAGEDANGRPRWTSEGQENAEQAAAPLPGSLSAGSSFESCLGYYSVRFVGVLGKWLMLYACDTGKGNWVFMRTSASPWGPWTEPLPITRHPEGYCTYLHAAPDPAMLHTTSLNGPLSTTRDDTAFARPGAPYPGCWPNPFDDEIRERRVLLRKDNSASADDEEGKVAVRKAGAPYAPFLLPEAYAKRLPNGRVVLFYTLSTWNPYQTILMRAELSFT